MWGMLLRRWGNWRWELWEAICIRDSVLQVGWQSTQSCFQGCSWCCLTATFINNLYVNYLRGKLNPKESLPHLLSSHHPILIVHLAVIWNSSNLSVSLFIFNTFLIPYHLQLLCNLQESKDTVCLVHYIISRTSNTIFLRIFVEWLNKCMLTNSGKC